MDTTADNVFIAFLDNEYQLVIDLVKIDQLGNFDEQLTEKMLADIN